MIQDKNVFILGFIIRGVFTHNYSFAAILWSDGIAEPKMGAKIKKFIKWHNFLTNRIEYSV